MAVRQPSEAIVSYDVHGDIMYAKDIDGRIAGLRSIPDNFSRGRDEDEDDELQALLDFRATVVGRYGADKWATGMSFVSGNYQGDYAQNQAEELYTGADTKYWDVDGWFEDYYDGWESFELEDQEYVTNGER